jgi:hypothetical protein
MTSCSKVVSIPNLPTPLPDEFLYSVIARAAIHLGHWSPKGLLGTIYGSRGTVAVADLPTSLARLGDLCTNHWGFGLDELATRHTLFSYYTHRMSTEDRALVFRAMLGNQANLHLRLGICAAGIVRTTHFRLCPTCTREDTARYGETYWRRSHHLPGILVCFHHAESLIQTHVPFRPIGVHEHVAAHPQLIHRGAPLMAQSAKLDVALDIARRSASLLDPCPPAKNADYRPRLRAAGFIGRRHGPARFRELVSSVISLSLWPRMFTSLNKDGLPKWLDVARGKPRRRLHPLKHILMSLVTDLIPQTEKFISTPIRSRDLRGLSSDPVLRKRATALAAAGCTTHAVAKQLDVAWKTADRLLRPLAQKPAAAIASSVCPDRRQWEALTMAVPAATRTQLRKRAQALYSRLYRNDREWLKLQSCAQKVRDPVTRVNWSERDTALAMQVEVTVGRIKARDPPIRASKTKVLRELQRRSLLAHGKAKLSNTVATLRDRCETVEAFQLRRIANVVKGQTPGLQSSDWRLLRDARINSNRLPDKGLALLAAARTLCR